MSKETYVQFENTRELANRNPVFVSRLTFKQQGELATTSADVYFDAEIRLRSH